MNMKNLLSLSTFALSAAAFASGPINASKPIAHKQNTVVAQADTSTPKPTKKEATKACKDEGKKGKDLKECVKEKTK